ncbi:DUF29 domain-containing protein [Candidatus Thiodictyon syntrophicum]|jgi:hypothetical protein|uniref:DUF29 domain-containing protein n=1 Tax=Candidatus Thiodictyon syntrophicum TaxID=1166950 RepID=A0A2K8U7Q6_9GAMM|nr:DUF29 domain-containing protein [Candidatus Thiodictyon syntrophicum]AUB81585.1 hypothetical protein THSYN_11870 [Candidatus Thiodictyon syntrophicum]
MSDISELYRSDYSAWAQRNAALLRAGDFAALDIAHLLEELDDMGKSEQRELENRLTMLLAHLLKWEYQLPTLSARWREFDGRSWRATIIAQRDRLAKRLSKSPGLQASLPATLAEAYDDAARLASKETQLPRATFPATCPYSIAQILDDGFYPGPEASP